MLNPSHYKCYKYYKHYQYYTYWKFTGKQKSIVANLNPSLNV